MYTSILENAQIGINTVSNSTCEESELTPNDYIKIIWTAAAELPGMKIQMLLYTRWIIPALILSISDHSLLAILQNSTAFCTYT